MDGFEIAPLPHRHRALSGKFQTGDEGRGPAGAPPQGAAGRNAGVRSLIGQQIRERHAVRCLAQVPQDALPGGRHGMARTNETPLWYAQADMPS